jgi:mannose-6-phosphate isomerase-like protein (cupin superfamily)
MQVPHLETDVRPWGHYVVIDEGAQHKVKRIVVAPGKRLSYQRHTHRSEHWFVVAGSGSVTLDGDKLTVSSGSAIDVPAGAAHRVENTGVEDLVFIEVQRGEYLGEDDIHRLEDDFGRAPSA